MEECPLPPSSDYIQLRELLNIQLGYQLRKLDVDKDLELRREGKPHTLIQLRDIDEALAYHEDLESVVYLLPKQSRYVLMQEDVLFLAKGKRNGALLAGPELAGRVPVSYFFILRVTSKLVLPAFLAWAINQERVQSDLKRRSQQGNAMPTITRSVFEETRIHLPPLNIQEFVIKLHALAEQEYRQSVRINDLRRLKAEALIWSIASGQVQAPNSRSI